MPDRCVPTQGPPLHSLDQALTRIRDRLRPVAGDEWVSIEDACGRVLAHDLASPIDSPPFANSAMDGYALRSADTAGSCGALTFEVVGTSWAGKPYQGDVGRNQCVRIFTGAALPSGTDAVVIQEEVQAIGAGITVPRPVAPGESVRAKGRDVAAGATALKMGKRLTPVDVGLIATLGVPEIAVTRRVRISLLATGDELRSPGSPLDRGTIYDSNRFALKAFLHALEVQLTDLGQVPDDPDILQSALTEASRWSDAIITIGGASVGDADHWVPVMKQLGEIDFWKVAIKPGKPFAFGRIGAAEVFGLPGNPVSAIVTFLQLVRPALLQLMGADPEPVLRLPARATRRIAKPIGRMEFQRAIFAPEPDGTMSVTPLPGQDADRQAPFSAANCLLLLPAESGGVEAGETVLIEPLINYF